MGTEAGLPEAPRFRDEPKRLVAVLVLGALAILLLALGAWWGILLVLAEIFYAGLRPVWSALHRGVDATRTFLRPVKRLPSALIGLPLLLVGLALGSWTPESVTWLADGVSAAVGGIATAAPYVIFFTLTPAIVGILATGRAGKFAIQANLAYVFLTLAAGALAILLMIPIFGVRFSGPGASGTATVEVDFLRFFFGSPPFLAIFTAAGVALMIPGFRLRGLHEAARFVGGKLVELLGDVLKILLPLVLLALGVFIPTRVGAAIEQARAAGTAAGSGWIGTLSAQTAYFAAIGVLVLILSVWLGAMAVAVMRYTRFPLSRFFRDYFFDVYAYAWATASSSSSIPINLERTGTALKVRSSIREFIIPLGATVHLDGTIISAFVSTVVAAQLVGYTPTALDLLYVLLPLMILTVGAPGIPGGLVIVAAPVLGGMLPLPPGTNEAFTAIFVAFSVGLADQFRSGVNATGNGILSRFFEHRFPRRPVPAGDRIAEAAHRVRRRRARLAAA